VKSVVIGADIYSLRYALEHNLSLYYVSPKKPHQFTDQLAEWHHLYWCLSLAGNIKFSNSISSLSVDSDDGTLKIIYNNRSKTLTNIDRFYIFDETDVQGLPQHSGYSSDKNEVLDWINVRSGMKHDFDRIENTSPFMECILFYPTKRIAGNHSLKDICVRSVLTTDEILQFEYSELVVKIKAQEVMEAMGIKGAGNGVGKFLSIKLESDRREVYPIGTPVYYSCPDNVVFRPQANVPYPQAGGYLGYLTGSFLGD
tara:strand:- start:536 stop:1303 length:768 start_codon:yes stop_codon:yes gene_type:complete